MSVAYWAVYGLGFEIDDLLRDTYIDKDGEEIEFYASDLNEEPFSELYDSNDFYVITDGDNYYLLYTPSPYWSMSDKEKAFTCKEDVAASMFETIKHLLKPEITIETFKEKIDWVNTYGAG